MQSPPRYDPSTPCSEKCTWTNVFLVAVSIYVPGRSLLIPLRSFVAWSSLWEASSNSADQDIFHHLWNTQIVYRVYTPRLYTMLCQLNPLYAAFLLFSHPRLGLLNVLLPLRFPTNVLYLFFYPNKLYTHHLDLVSEIRSVEEYKCLSCYLCHSSVLLLLLVS